jgi:rhamnulokinase
MGLWVLQSVRRNLGDVHSFPELANMAREAEKSAPPDWAIDLNLPRFLAPASMIDEIKDEYKSQGKKVPDSPGELAYAVYTSLAQCYKTAGKTYSAISIIGGGSRDSYLNALTAEYTGKTVYAGPTEATSTGNILLQMKEAKDPAVKDGFTELVKRSFDINEFKGR